MKRFGFKEAALAGVLAAAVPSSESGCDDKQIDLPTIEAVEGELIEVKNGDWRFTVKATVEVSLAGTKEKTFYHWLSTKMKKDSVFVELAEEDKAVFIDGLIALSRVLNPSLNLDDFPLIKAVGVSLVFPVNVLVEPKSEKIFSITEGGYSRLQELATADGFLIDQEKKQQEIFDKALAGGQKIPTSPWFYLDRQGSEDSPAVLAPDVIGRLEDFGQAFSRLSFGGKKNWRICLTDIMRDPAAQEKRNEMKGSTHTTGRSFDISSGRFLTPEGKIITWSVFDSKGEPTGESSVYAKMIDEEMQPAIERLIGQYGLIPFKEGTHWHVYAPKNRTIDLTEELVIEMTAVSKSGLSCRGKEVAARQKEELPSTEMGSEIARRMNEVFAAEQARIVSERLTSAEVDSRLAELRPQMDEFFDKRYPGKKVKFQFLTILSYDGPSELGRAVKRQLIDLVRVMSADDVERLGILLGSTVHSDERPPFFDLRGIWQWKREKKTDKTARKFVDAVLRLDLEAIDHSVDIGVWYQKQQAAIGLLRRHADKFGFRSEVLAYLTPEVMLAVIHAEFFSELGGPTFVEMSPVIFEPYNIVFGPAVNDHRCSSGPVQLIETTFIGFLDNHRDDFRAIKEEEGEMARFVVPRVELDEKGQPVDGEYDPDSFAEAMVGNPDSVIFYATFSVADHTRRAFNVLFANEGFREIWNNASEGDRLLFVGSFAPLAINGGGGTAKRAAESLLVDEHLTNLREMAEDLPTHTNKKLARRGAWCGFKTTGYLIKRAEKE